ncbi:MAG: hypothetical protein KatS3mg105_4226 [Gemmatales bacterium]|nr:MAG: hypothetical protein KatS3mg105_4226 [Gemmatales bacterium]
MNTGWSFSNIEAIVFDAVGTLLYANPPVSQVYAQTARQFGSQLGAEEIARRFRELLSREWRHDDPVSSESLERERWRRIVASVLDDVADVSGCFAWLFDYFGKPDSWRCPPSVVRLLSQLKGAGYRLAMASNFDARLRRIWKGKLDLEAIGELFISSEIGWRKPSPMFYSTVIRSLQIEPWRILFVGDENLNDYDGPRSAGMRALLVEPCGVAKQDRHRLQGAIGRFELEDLAYLMPLR